MLTLIANPKPNFLAPTFWNSLISLLHWKTLIHWKTYFISHVSITMAFNHTHPLLASTSDPHCFPPPAITIFTFHRHHPLPPPEPPRSSALTIFTFGPFFHRHCPLPPPEPPRSSAVSPPSPVFNIYRLFPFLSLHSNFTSLPHTSMVLIQKTP